MLGYSFYEEMVGITRNEITGDMTTTRAIIRLTGLAKREITEDGLTNLIVYLAGIEGL